MSEPPVPALPGELGRPAAERGGTGGLPAFGASAPPGALVPGAAGGDTPRQDPGRSPTTSWPLWTVPVVLIGALILTTIASLLIDIPAAALGATVTGSHISPGVQIADTFIQDVCFVLVSIWFAQLGGRKVASWQFGLRRPPRGWWRAIGLIGLLIACFLVLIAVWQEAFNPSREKLLEELGTNEGAALLVLSAALTCIVAPISEEFLFRGYIFTALRNWRGTPPAALITGLIFGGVHAGSAPALDLIPLAGLGFGLCLLYRYTGSLYPCFAAHALNNCVAFGSLEGWDWQVPLLIAGSLAGITCVVVLFKRIGLIADAAAEQSLTAAVP